MATGSSSGHVTGGGVQASGAGCRTNCAGGWTHIHTGRCASTSLSAAYELGDEPVFVRRFRALERLSEGGPIPSDPIKMPRIQHLGIWDRMGSKISRLGSPNGRRKGGGLPRFLVCAACVRCAFVAIGRASSKPLFALRVGVRSVHRKGFCRRKAERESPHRARQHPRVRLTVGRQRRHRSLRAAYRGHSIHATIITSEVA